uniref:Alpha/beta hydrolase fold protein n=1 Tax=Tanacetum cinerariifolium TaxID=118510 RepID=A0A6L2LIV1_TANCI|nr:alpha/beta hydrolase fold protein [Tanacetum cinerariifolium]
MGDLLIRGGILPIQSLDYNNGTGIISPFLPQALFDDIFSRLLALTSYIRNRFIQFFEDLVYRDVSRFSEDFVALSSCQDLDSSNRKSASASCASTSKNLGTILDERSQKPSSIEDHSSLLSRCEIIERKFFYGGIHFLIRGLDLARYFVKSTLLLALAPYQISSQCVKHAQIRVQSTLSRIQISFHGSSADIGWIQRDPTMDPVKDGSDRFVELLNAIRNGEHKLPDSYVYLLIPGLFSNHGPLYFVSTKRFFSKMGLACHIAKIHSEASVEYNSLILKQYIEELYWGSGKRVMLLGHSKGGVDAAAALSLYWSDLKGKVAGLALVQSPYGGTPIASDIMREGQIADKETRRIMKLIVCKIIKGDIKSLEDLTYEKRKQFLSQHKLPKGIPLISFRSEANVGPGVGPAEKHRVPLVVPVSVAMALSALHLQLRYGEKSDGLVTYRDAEVPGSVVVGPAEKHRVPLVVPVSAAMALSALHLQLRYGEKSDGLVTCRDAEVPGSVVVRPNQKLDHAWKVYSSWNKNQAGADASEMCEALLTMLGAIKSLEDLTYEKRKQFLCQHKLLKGIPLISFRFDANVGPGVISMMSHRAHVELPKLSFLGNTSDESEYEVGPAEKHRVPLVVPVFAAMALSALHLQLRYEEKSDGLVTCRDVEVPGSVVVRPNQKLDHAWKVYSSWNKNQAGADASEMCKALLTMLVELGKADNSGS